MQSHPSVCRHALSCVVSTRIDARFARNKAPPVFGDQGVRFKNVLIAVICRLRRFERQGVDDFLLNLKQHSCKPQPRRN